MQLTKWAVKVPYLLLLKCSMTKHIPTSSYLSVCYHQVLTFGISELVSTP